MPHIPGHLLFLFLCCFGLSSCTSLCFTFKELGEKQAVYTFDKPAQVYKIGDSYYASGSVHYTRQYGPAWFRQDLNAGPYATRQISAPRPCYIRLSLDHYHIHRTEGTRDIFDPAWFIDWETPAHLASLPDTARTATPPGAPLMLPDTFCMGGQPTLHALYAYPLAAATGLCIDLPLALSYWTGSMLIGAPAIFISNALQTNSPDESGSDASAPNNTSAE